MKGRNRGSNLKDKAIAAGVTLIFLALVRPDPVPGLCETGLVALMLYETVIYCIRFNRRIRREEKQQKNKYYRKQDGERWAGTWLRWPMKEVS